MVEMSGEKKEVSTCESQEVSEMLLLCCVGGSWASFLVRCKKSQVNSKTTNPTKLPV
jgi:hypothetical protein